MKTTRANARAKFWTPFAQNPESAPNTLLVFTHNYALLTQGSRFLGCNVHANQ